GAADTRGSLHRALMFRGRSGMRQRFGFLGTLGLVVWLAVWPAAEAVEYKLRVVSMPDTSYTSLLLPGEFMDGAARPRLNRLEAALDSGEFPAGPVLFDRRVQPVRDSISRAYRGVRVLPELIAGGVGSVVWDEMTWEGNPGEQSVWVIAPIINNFQEVYNFAMKGTGPLRNYQPFSYPMDGSRETTDTSPLTFTRFY